MRAPLAIVLLMVACGRGPTPSTVIDLSTGTQPNPLCTGLPPLGLPYCLGVNRNEAPVFLRATYDLGDDPSAPYRLVAADGGVRVTHRGDIPFQARENPKEVDLDLSHAVLGSLRGLTESFDRPVVSGGHGIYGVAVAVWFHSTPGSPDCPYRHHWLAVGLRPSHPLLPSVSRDVVYRGAAAPCGGMYVFDVTGPTVHWTRGTPLVIDWCALLDRVHAAGWWRDVRCDATDAITEFVEIAGMTPGGVAEPILTGGATLELGGWTSSR